jgi:cytochrome c biogenesis factor
LLSPLTNHRGQGKSESHGQQFGQFNRVAFKERSELVFDQQMSYRRALEDTFRYQNTMSNGTTQERAAMTVELRDVEHARQQQVLRQVEQLRLDREQAQKLALAEEQQQAFKLEQSQQQKRSRGMSLGL